MELNINTRIKRLRNEHKLTQKELAESANISESYYRKIETGNNSPSIETLNNIAKALDVSLLYLINDRIEEMENRSEIEELRLREIFKNIPKEQLDIAEGLIIQAARLRILLDDNWKDILENGEYERFRQSKDQIPYDRKRPIVENYDNRDKTYKDIIRQLSDLLPRQNAENRTAADKLLGR